MFELPREVRMKRIDPRKVAAASALLMLPLSMSAPAASRAVQAPGAGVTQHVTSVSDHGLAFSWVVGSSSGAWGWQAAWTITTTAACIAAGLSAPPLGVACAVSAAA
jgi:hypothetical protein